MTDVNLDINTAIEGISTLVLASLTSIVEMRHSVSVTGENIVQCLQDVGQLEETLEQVRRHSDRRVSQCTLEQFALVELHELYLSML